MENLTDTDLIYLFLNWICTPFGAVITCIITLVLIAAIAIAYCLCAATEEMINDYKNILNKQNK